MDKIRRRNPKVKNLERQSRAKNEDKRGIELVKMMYLKETQGRFITPRVAHGR